MRKLISVIALALAIMCCQMSHAENATTKSKSKFGITIAAAKPIFYAGGPLVMIITVTNNSPEKAFYIDKDPEAQFRFTVLYPSGKPVPLTLLGQEVARRYPAKLDSSSGGEIQRLRSGETAKYKLVLTAYYDMTVMNEYKISVQRDFGVYDETMVATSNTTTSENDGIDPELRQP